MSLSSDYPEYEESAGFITREEIQRCAMGHSDLEKEHKGEVLKVRRRPDLVMLHRELYRRGIVIRSPARLETLVRESRSLEMGP